MRAAVPARAHAVRPPSELTLSTSSWPAGAVAPAGEAPARAVRDRGAPVVPVRWRAGPRAGWLLWLLCVVPAAGARAAQPITLGEAVPAALARNASLRALEAEVAAARARLEGASALLPSNPELELAVGPRAAPDGRATDYSIGLSQQVELFGQRGARRDGARALLDAAEARLEAGRVELAAEAREGFARALAARERARLAAEAYTLARQALAAAEAREAAGAASRLEVNAARAALGHATRQRAEAEQRAVAARTALILLVAADPAAPLELAGELEPAAPGPAEDVERLVDRALRGRAELRAARREVDAARAEARLAQREALPSPRLGITYAEEGSASGRPTRVTQGTLALDLPLFQRNQAGRGIAAARVAQAGQALEALTRSVRAEVMGAASRLATARAAVEAFTQGLTGAAEENVQLVHEAYRAGKMDLIQLLVVQRETLEARNAYIDALEELAAARAELSRVTGSME